VNNANIAIENVSSSPLDVTNNWWGMPKGASDQNRAGGDWVGWNITTQPHLTIIPPNCDLSVANWIPFSEQELQNAVMTQLPYTGGLDFVLLDIQKGSGVQFSLVAKPEYGGQSGEAYITITPSPDGTLMMLMLDFSRLPADSTLSQIATCSLMPLFLNSLQLVQNKFTQPSQLIEQMVVMDSSLMMLFSPPTEITPDPAPEIVMNYDLSCLPPAIPPTPTPTPPPQNEGESLIQIPPMEGELELLIENNTTLTQHSLVIGTPDPCEPNEGGWCILLPEVGDVFTYANEQENPNGGFISMNRVVDGIVRVEHPAILNNITAAFYPSWGKVAQNHYRLAFQCSSGVCYWDSSQDSYIVVSNSLGYPRISPDGTQIINPDQVWGSTLFNLAGGHSFIYNTFSPSWSNSSLYYVYGSFPTISPRIRKHPDMDLTGYGYNNGTEGYSVYENNNIIEVLYWVGSNNSFQLMYYNSGAQPTTRSILASDRLGYVMWSPRGSRFIIVVPQSGSYDTYDMYLYENVNSTANPIHIITNDFSRGIEWASGIDLVSLYNQPPTPQAKCLDNSQNPTPQDCINELAQYGISADATGLTSAWANQASFAQAWTLDELQGIMAGVENSAKAFFMLKYSGQTFDKAVAKTLFNTVMGNFSVLRVKMNAGTYFMIDSDGDGDGDECVNISFSACTSNYAQVITFYDTIFTNFSQGTQGISEYLMVHEMGHRFNARSDGSGGRTELSLYGRFDSLTIQDISKNIYDSTTRLVMGIVTLQGPGGYYNDWARGKRGWGSGPHAPFNEYGYLPKPNNCSNQDRCRDQTKYITNFQQNSFTIDNLNVTPTNSDDATTEIDEATADMFLNWVYYKSSGSGFINWKWSNIFPSDNCENATGCPDDTNPGEARFNRMNAEMQDIFNDRGW